MALENSDDKCPCFIINDLSKDSRFAHLPIVDGSLASYKFYAGAPIATSRGINIGSFFLFDDRVRDGLPINQRKCVDHQVLFPFQSLSLYQFSTRKPLM
jgi:GAF domain-containing protein